MDYVHYQLIFHVPHKYFKIKPITKVNKSMVEHAIKVLCT